MSLRDEIIRRYKRKVIAHPEGAVVHDGDCGLHATFVRTCTCGLHHWLLPSDPEVVDELYPKYHDEQEGEILIEYLLQEFMSDNLYVKEKGEFVPVEKPVPRTKEEIKKDMDMIAEHFKKLNKGKNDD